MGNPFDVPEAVFLVLKNEAGEHSLWPEFLPVPGGWAVQHGPANRERCLSYVETHWRALRSTQALG